MESRGAEFAARDIARRLVAVRRWREDAAGAELRDELSLAAPAQLVAVLAAQRLTALAGSRAVELLGGAAPEPLVQAVERDRARNLTRGLALEALSVDLSIRLAEQGIQCLTLKGPRLARRLHRDVGLRMSNDIDLLVAREDLEGAASLIGRLGYAVSPPRANARPPVLHLELRHERGGLPRIDLHWRVHWYEEEFSSLVLSRSTASDGPLRAPRADDELACLLLYYARDGLYGLRALADIAAWWDRYGDGVHDGPVLASHAAEHQHLRRAFAAAAVTAERVGGVPAARLLPTDVLGGRKVRLAGRTRELEPGGRARSARVQRGARRPTAGAAGGAPARRDAQVLREPPRDRRDLPA